MPRHASIPIFTAAVLAANAALAVDKGTTTAIGTAITYQGELRSGGQPASGLFDFEACLFVVPTPDPTPPIACVTSDEQPLDALGRFTLALDFGAQFNGSARFLEMRVRGGSETGPYTTLLPRQAIRPTPEALRAASAPWGGLVGAPAGFSDNIDNVGITSLAAGSGLTTNPAVPGAGAPIGTAGTLSVRPAGIDAGMIAPAAIGLAQIDPTQVQARVAGSCAVGDYVNGIGQDGALLCASLPSRFDQVLDQNDDVGSEVALALRSGDLPLLAYYHAGFGNLKLHACFDRACSSGNTRTLDSPGDVGRAPAIAIGPDGRAFIAYLDVSSAALKFYVCANAACSSGTARTLDDARDVTASIGMAIRPDGRPLIAYGNTTTFDARVFDCADVDCSGGVSRSIASSMHGGASLAVAIDAGGLPVIAKGGNGGAGTPVFVLRCADAACTSATATSLVSNYSSHVALVLRANDRPLLATTTPGLGVDVVDCGTSTCSSWSPREISSDTGDGGDGVAMALDGATPVLAFRRFVDSDQTYLRFHRCLASSCSTAAATRTLDGGDGDPAGGASAIVVRSDGRPVIAHHDLLNDDLLLHVCANPDCT
jgi:hypothetical protein